MRLPPPPLAPGSARAAANDGEPPAEPGANGGDAVRRPDRVGCPADPIRIGIGGPRPRGRVTRWTNRTPGGVEPIDQLRAVAHHWLAARRFDRAEAAVRDVLAADPADAFALAALGEVLCERNDLPAAAEAARAAVAAHPAVAGCHASLARVCLATRNAPAAVAAAPRGGAAAAAVAVRAGPAGAGAVQHQRPRRGPAGSRGVFGGRPGGAERAGHRRPDVPGRGRPRRGRAGAARALLQAGPAEGFCLGLAGRVFRQIGLRSQGMQLLRAVVQQDPNRPAAHEALAFAYWNRGDVPAAPPALPRGRPPQPRGGERPPDPPPAQPDAAAGHADRVDADPLPRHGRRRRPAAPDDPRTTIPPAVANRRDGRRGVGGRAVTPATDPAYERGMLLYHRGRYRQAADEFRRAISAHAGHADGYAMLGMSLLLAGDRAGAAVEIHQAVRLGPDQSFPHYALACLTLKPARGQGPPVGVAVGRDPPAGPRPRATCGGPSRSARGARSTTACWARWKRTPATIRPRSRRPGRRWPCRPATTGAR